MKNIVLLLSFSLLLVAASYSPIGVHDYRVRKVVIDAGHGGKDPGTHGKISKEKDIALKIALELGQTIKKYLPDVEVLYSRKDDSFPSLHERAQFANRNNADLFIQTFMPSVLVETGYLSNEQEEKELNDPLQQSYIASGIFRAFRDYKDEIESMN